MVNSMMQVNLSEIRVPMAVIYDSPTDFPGVYVCRIWEGATGRPTNIAMKKELLEEIREDLEAAGFFTVFPRADGDDPVIVETWMK